MARTSEQITQNEINAYAKFCAERRVIFGGTEGEQNAEFIGNYFVNVWKQDITEQNLNTAWEQLRPYVKLYTLAQAEYYKVAMQMPDRANRLSNWLATQGKVGQLVNQGDEAFENLRLLLVALRDNDINPTAIRHAEDRAAHTPGPQLHYVPQPRKEMGTITEAARNDDGKPFLGEHINEPAWAKRSRERSEREAAEAKSGAATSASAQSAAVREARRKAEEMRGNTHSEDEQLARIFVTVPGTSEIDWVQTAAAREALQRSLNKAQEIRRFIR
jgi:hypothetical protein